MRVFKSNEELKSLIVDGNIIIDDDITCDFNIDVNANIKAYNINSYDINAGHINAGHIKAYNINAYNINSYDINANDINAGHINAGHIKAWYINAGDISYYAFCVAYKDIGCKSIKGRRSNSFHKCLDGKLTIKEKLKKITIEGETFHLNKENLEDLKNQLK